MDLNFNNYICSVIALSLINLSNFWGAVHSVNRGHSYIGQKGQFNFGCRGQTDLAQGGIRVWVFHFASRMSILCMSHIFALTSSRYLFNSRSRRVRPRHTCFLASQFAGSTVRPILNSVACHATDTRAKIGYSALSPFGFFM